MSNYALRRRQEQARQRYWRQCRRLNAWPMLKIGNAVIASREAFRQMQREAGHAV